jgi:hypothetical protein
VFQATAAAPAQTFQDLPALVWLLRTESCSYLTFEAVNPKGLDL